MERKARARTTGNFGKFSRVTEWPCLFCHACGYAVELCRRTRDFSFCPVCLKQGKRNPLERLINRV